MSSSDSSSSYSRLNVAIGLGANLVSSVAIIQVNKYIYVYYGYSNMALTCLHFILTFLGLVICQAFGLFQFKRVPIVKMIPMSFSYCGFVLLTNYSLQYNSIGTYQCFKALTTPIIVAIDTLIYHKRYSTKVKLTVVPVLLGIFFNSMYDLKFSSIGVFIGLAGALITSVYQVWVGTKQKELQLSAQQLLFYQAPLSALLLATAIPFFEPLTGAHGVLNLARPIKEWLVIISSGALAFFVNLTIYWIIGTTSALTYNMTGYFKFTLTIVFGLIIFKDPFKMEQIFATVLVILGLILYSYYKMKEAEEEKQRVQKNNDLNTLESQKS